MQPFDYKSLRRRTSNLDFNAFIENTNLRTKNRSDQGANLPPAPQASIANSEEKIKTKIVSEGFKVTFC